MQLLLAQTRRAARLQWACSPTRCISKVAARATTKALHKLPDTPARTRFAPSPTGFLHLGSLRTALFSYLLAKSTGGQFILRLEDTDQKRTIPGAEERIKEDLKWAGLQWDEGPDVEGPYGPYKQSERLWIYREYAEKLLETNKAYRCFCPKEMLAKEAGDVQGGIHTPPGINPHDCPHISKETSNSRVSQGQSHVVRLRLGDHLPGYKDMVYGKVPSMKTGHAQDTILLKSDGWPTYHLACVVDDHLMKITHVIRGTEWTPSTPFHFMIYEAFGWTPPVFGHVGLLTNVHGEKFSKRKADIDLSSFQKRGVLPDALANFVALLGWSHTGKEDFMTPQQLIENFSTKFTKGDVKVQFDKLWFLQRKHAIEAITKASSPKDLERDMINPLIEVLKTMDTPLVDGATEKDLKETLFRLMKADMRNWTNVEEFAARHHRTLVAPTENELRAQESSIVLSGHLSHRDAMKNFVPLQVPNKDIVEIVRQLPALLDKHVDMPVDERFLKLNADFLDVLAPVVEKQIAGLAQPLGETDAYSLNKSWVAMVHKYLKWAVVLNTPGPDVLRLMLVLGKEESMRRLELAEKVALEAGKAALETSQSTLW